MKHNSFFTVLALGLSIACAGCSTAAADVPPGKLDGMPQATSEIEVRVTSPTRQNLSRDTEFVGKLESHQSINVYPEMTGKVLKAYYNVGETVRAGDALLEMDTEELQKQVESAQTSFELTKLQVESSLGGNYDSQLIQQGATYDSAKLSYDNAIESLQDYRDNDSKEDLEDAVDEMADARDEAERVMNEAQQAVEAKRAERGSLTIGSSGYEEKYERLTKELSSLQESYQAAQSSYSTAQTTYQQLKSQLDTYEDSSDEEISALIKSVKAARISLESAGDTIDLTKGKLREETEAENEIKLKQAQQTVDDAVSALDDAVTCAPISGTISVKNISDFDMASTQSIAYVISGEGDPVVTFQVSEAGADALEVGSIVTVTYNGGEYEAKIIELSNVADSATGLYAAKAQTTEKLGTNRTGTVVKVRASTAHAENALTLPLDLVEYDGNQPYVYVYRDGKAVRTDIVTGMSTAETIVVESGLAEEDEVITTWHPDLKDGAAVRTAEKAGE